MRHALLILLWMCIAGLFQSCYRPPSFPDNPEIEFTSIRKVTSVIDSVWFTVRFRDGNGDLGLGDNDLSGPFAEFITDPGTGQRVRNRFYYNFFVKIFRLNPANNQFEEVVLPDDLNFNSRFPLLNRDGRNTPLEGDMTFRIDIPFIGSNPLRRGDTVLFEISIADRRPTESNRVRTTALVIGR